MLKVKFPKNLYYDGSVNSIKINSVIYLNGHILVYGKTSKKSQIIIEIKYDDNKNTWVMIAQSFKNIIRIIKENKGKELDITDDMLKELSNARITNTEELNYQFAKDCGEESIEDVKLSIEDTVKDILKENAYNLPFDPEEAASLYKRKVFKAISNFLEDNVTYSNSKYQLQVISLLEKIFQTILNYPDIFFTEDDLINIGVLLNKLSCLRVASLNQEEFDLLIAKGYDLINNFEERKTISL